MNVLRQGHLQQTCGEAYAMRTMGALVVLNHGERVGARCYVGARERPREALVNNPSAG